MEEHYIAGKHSVLEAIRAGRTIVKIWIAEQAQPQQMQSLIAEAKKANIVVQTADKRKLDQFVKDVPHQGVVAQAAAHHYVEPEELLQRAAAKGTEPFLLILDELEDPHNLGSILRTADCAGVDGIIIPKRRAVGLTAAVSKISAGAVEYVPVARVTNIAQTIDWLKERGVWIAGADASADGTAYEANLNLPLAIVIGNEGKGIGRLIKQKCDFTLRLPMMGQINSLNASVAAGVLMYEVVRQRQQSAR